MVNQIPPSFNVSMRKHFHVQTLFPPRKTRLASQIFPTLSSAGACQPA